MIENNKEICEDPSRKIYDTVKNARWNDIANIVETMQP